MQRVLTKPKENHVMSEETQRNLKETRSPNALYSGLCRFGSNACAGSCPFAYHTVSLAQHHHRKRNLH